MNGITDKIMETLLYLGVLSFLIIGLLIYFAISTCTIELKYRNQLLEDQNEILKNSHNENTI